MKDDDTLILDGEADEDSDTKIIGSEDTVVDEPKATVNETRGESTVVVDDPADEPKVINNNDSVKTPLEEPRPYRPATPETPKKESKKWIAWLVGLVVLGGAGVGAWFVFSNDSNDVNNQADHSDDDEFENFGRMRRAVEENVESQSYEPYYDYVPAEVAVPADSIAW